MTHRIVDNVRPYLLSAFLFGLPLSALAAGETDADTCALDGRYGNAECTVRDLAADTWISTPEDGAGHLHQRARRYADWLHRAMLPAGGVMQTLFADADLEEPVAYGARRDSAIWTGSYLAAEALRLMTTGSADAAARVKDTVRVIDRWWRISGDAGYLARYAAPADSPQPILDALMPAIPDDPTSVDPEVHRDTPFDDALWHWRSQTSRDQYQGVLLGFSLAYDATDDALVRALIRENVVAFAEQLMREEERNVDIIVDGTPLTNVGVRFQHVVFTDDETPDGQPVLNLDLDSGDVDGLGVLVFWPNASEFIRQVPGLGWVPPVESPLRAIQLAAAFRVALQVTEGVPGWEDSHQALRDHYERHVSEWLEIASAWERRDRCGDAYYGINIGFMPLFNWARLETDPARRARIQRDILRDGLWAEVEDHKNVFFAFLYAAQAPTGEPLEDIVAQHRDQLAQFPSAPNLSLPRDLRGQYPEDPECPGLSEVAIDVADRVPTGFLWERQPWKLEDPGSPNLVFSGVDYLLAYWLGRYHGFIDDDAPQTATRWRTLPPPDGTTASPWQLLIPSVTPSANGASVRVFFLPIERITAEPSGLDLRLHWDSFALNIEQIDNILPEGFETLGTPTTDALDLDGDPATDRWIELVWTGNPAGWSTAGTAPTLLFTVDVSFVPEFAGSTSLGFSVGAPAPDDSVAPWRTVLETDGAFMRQVQQMYVGYYGRPGDPVGIGYWADRLRQAGGNWTAEIVDAFGNSDEYLTRFGGLPPATLIDQLYQQLFGRNAESVGKSYYLDLLTGTNDSGLNPQRRQSTLAQIALDIANGALNQDADTLNNKLDVAAYFSELVDENGRRYQSADIQDAVAVLTGVHETPASLVSQVLASDAFMTRVPE